MRLNIEQTIANAAGVPITAVAITLTAASTRVEAVITLLDATTAPSTINTLQSGILASTASLQSALAANGVSTNVLISPTITSTAISPPPPPPPAPPPPTPPPPSPPPLTQPIDLTNSAALSIEEADGESNGALGVVAGTRAISPTHPQSTGEILIDPHCVRVRVFVCVDTQVLPQVLSSLWRSSSRLPSVSL